MPDPYRANYYEGTNAPQGQYSNESYPGSNYSQPSQQHELQLSQSSAHYPPAPTTHHATLAPPPLAYPPSPSYSYPSSPTAGSPSYHSHRHSHRHRHRSHSRPASNYSRSPSPSPRSRSRHSSRHADKDHRHSNAKGLGATLAGAAGGAFLGHEIGGGALGTLSGVLAGAIGANALERRHQRHKSSSRRRKSTSPSGFHRADSADRGLRARLEGLLVPGAEKRRARSHAGADRRGGDESWSEDEGRRGGRRW